MILKWLGGHLQRKPNLILCLVSVKVAGEKIKDMTLIRLLSRVCVKVVKGPSDVLLPLIFGRRIRIRKASRGSSSIYLVSRHHQLVLLTLRVGLYAGGMLIIFRAHRDSCDFSPLASHVPSSPVATIPAAAPHFTKPSLIPSTSTTISTRVSTSNSFHTSLSQEPSCDQSTSTSHMRSRVSCYKSRGISIFLVVFRIGTILC